MDHTLDGKLVSTYTFRQIDPRILVLEVNYGEENGSQFMTLVHPGIQSPVTSGVERKVGALAP